MKQFEKRASQNRGRCANDSLFFQGSHLVEDSMKTKCGFRLFQQIRCFREFRRGRFSRAGRLLLRHHFKGNGLLSLQVGEASALADRDSNQG
jgi:hypothetical protein